MATVPQFQANLQEALYAELNSTLFTDNTLLALVTGHGRSDSKLGRPGAMSRLKLDNPAAYAVAYESNSSPTARVRFQYQSQGGGAVLTRNGNTPSVSNGDVADSMVFSFTALRQPIEIPKPDMILNSGKYAVANIVADYMEDAIHNMEDLVGYRLWGVDSGGTNLYPSSQQNFELWTNQIGIKYALYDAATAISGHYVVNTHKYYGGKDRSSISVLTPALFSTAAKRFSFKLIDDARSAASPKGGKLDVWLCNPTLFFGPITQTAKAEGATIVTNGEIPMFGMSGFKQEYVQYGSSIITYDSKCPAGVNGGTSMLAGLTLQDWSWQTHPDADFKLSELAYRGQYAGNKDCYDGFIETYFRFFCRKPQRQVLYGDVS